MTISPRLHVEAKNPVEAGKYLVLVAGCNDCHTPGWDRHPDAVPMSRWLIGKSVGFRGPWGVSYPGNIRRLMATMPTAAAWIHFVRHWHAMPPMPITNLRNMSNTDLKAIYAFVRTLKPLGKAAPTSLGLGQAPTTPYIEFIPQKPK